MLIINISSGIIMTINLIIITEHIIYIKIN